jgi:hypothetical protein
VGIFCFVVSMTYLWSNAPHSVRTVTFSGTFFAGPRADAEMRSAHVFTVILKLQGERWAADVATDDAQKTKMYAAVFASDKTPAMAGFENAMKALRDDYLTVTRPIPHSDNSVPYPSPHPPCSYSLSRSGLTTTKSKSLFLPSRGICCARRRRRPSTR